MAVGPLICRRRGAAPRVQRRERRRACRSSRCRRPGPRAAGGGGARARSHGRRRVQHLAPNDATWPRLVTVYVERSGADSASTPAVIGRYVVSGDRLRSEPRFPFAAGVSYRVEVDTSALRRGPDSGATRAAPLAHRFVLPTVTLSGQHGSRACIPRSLASRATCCAGTLRHRRPWSRATRCSTSACGRGRA